MFFIYYQLLSTVSVIWKKGSGIDQTIATTTAFEECFYFFSELQRRLIVLFAFVIVIVIEFLFFTNVKI